MKNTIRTIAQLIQNTTKEGSPINDCAAQIGKIAETATTKDEACRTVQQLALEMANKGRATTSASQAHDEIVYAIDFCNMVEGLCKFGEGSTTFLPQWKIDTIEEILAADVTRVPSNAMHTRFYTENLADSNYENEHHLIDIYHKDGKPYYRLNILESEEGKNPIQIKLVNNEVQELLCILLSQCLEEAGQQHKAREYAIYKPSIIIEPLIDEVDLP